MLSKSFLKHSFYLLLFLSVFLDPGSSLGIRNIILAISFPSLLLLSLPHQDRSYISPYAILSFFILSFSVLYSLWFKPDIDIDVAFPYWFIISLITYFIFTFSNFNNLVRFKIYLLFARIFVVACFSLLIFFSLFKLPLSSQVGPLFIGLTSSFPGVFLYHASSLYVPSLFCLGFSVKQPTPLDSLLLLLLFILFFLSQSIGGMCSSFILILVTFNRQLKSFLSSYAHNILLFLLLSYFLFLSFSSFAIDGSIFSSPSSSLSSTEIKIGHFISFVNSISPVDLLFGEGPGSLFNSISKDYLVYDIELSPIEAIRKFGLLFCSLFLVAIYSCLLRLSRTKSSGFISLSILLLIANSFWNPLLFGILTAIILSELVVVSFPSKY